MDSSATQYLSQRVPAILEPDWFLQDHLILSLLGCWAQRTISVTWCGSVCTLSHLSLGWEVVGPSAVLGYSTCVLC